MNYLDLQNAVYASLGRDDSDPVAGVLVPLTINFAACLTALQFRPPELQVEQQIVVPSLEYVDISSINAIDILRVYNGSGDRDLYYLPMESLRTLTATSAAPTTPAQTKFYTLHGNYLYVRPFSKNADTYLTLYYLKYPTDMTNPTDLPGFEHHDSYILSIATAICWAGCEEGDSSNLWTSLANLVGSPLALGAKGREVIAGKMARLQAVIGGAK